MLQFDHLTLPVLNWIVSRDWYVGTLGMRVEFEVPDRQTAALRDEHDFTIFFQQSNAAVVRPAGIALYFQVADVAAAFRNLSTRGVSFLHSPQRVDWGYGAELSDPDGYLIRLWDETSMREMTKP